LLGDVPAVSSTILNATTAADVMMGRTVEIRIIMASSIAYDDNEELAMERRQGNGWRGFDFSGDAPSYY
jgi:hypothetical protein